jgi:hypothetical protein
MQQKKQARLTANAADSDADMPSESRKKEAKGIMYIDRV